MAREQTSLQSAAAWASLTTRAIRRQSLVSSSSTSWLMAATGICLASNITKASNRRVKPLPSLAQGSWFEEGAREPTFSFILGSLAYDRRL